MAKIKIDSAVLEDYQKTAVKWMPTLLDLPIRQANDVLKFMTGITGLRGKMKLGEINADSQFAPFKKTRKGDAAVNISYREIETFLGNVVEEFSPVDYAYLTMGYTDATLGEKIKNASTTALVLFHLAKARGQHIAQAILTGVPYKIGGNVLNAGLIDNLPADACVEVPCLIEGQPHQALRRVLDGQRLRSAQRRGCVQTQSLPPCAPQCAALCSRAGRHV